MNGHTITTAQRAHRIATVVAIVRRSIVEQANEGGLDLTVDEKVCLLGAAETEAVVLRNETDASNFVDET